MIGQISLPTDITAVLVMYNTLRLADMISHKKWVFEDFNTPVPVTTVPPDSPSILCSPDLVS